MTGGVDRTVAKASPKLVRTVRNMRKHVAKWRENGKTVALVPTMGALHNGHLTLVKQARKKADRVIVSIFVNPTQFAPHEDLSRYPRDEAGDLAKLAQVGADLVWAPAPEEMYPEGFATHIVPEGAALELEGDARPGHFTGVVTVCLKLFTAVAPDIAIFGEKDFQQVCVLRQMVRDFLLPLRILALRTVRENDGLALSSRNTYLNEEERSAAPTLFMAISEVAASVQQGADVAAATAKAKHQLIAAGFTKTDYVEVRDAETLVPYDPASSRPGRVLAAAWLGKTRLIDNVHIEPPQPRNAAN
jgi:pantoate--beta-alanine ligase